jgi:hypothetical protein
MDDYAPEDPYEGWSEEELEEMYSRRPSLPESDEVADFAESRSYASALRWHTLDTYREAAAEQGGEILVGEQGDVLLESGSSLAIIGSFGTTKTTLALDLLAHMNTGKAVLDRFDVQRPMKCGILAAEGTANLLLRKLEQKHTSWATGYGHDLDLRVLGFDGRSLVRGMNLREPQNRGVLLEALDEWTPDVLMLDPLKNLGMDDFKPSDVAAWFEAMHDLAKIKGFGLIVLHHTQHNASLTSRGPIQENADASLLIARTGKLTGLLNIQKMKDGDYDPFAFYPFALLPPDSFSPPDWDNPEDAPNEKTKPKATKTAFGATGKKLEDEDDHPDEPSPDDPIPF